jgi:polyisoprenoid-binding protein YceI
MSRAGFWRRKSTYLIGIPLIVVLVAVVAPYVYIHFIEGDPPKKLELSSTPERKSSTSSSPSSAVPAGVDGTWKPTSDSKAGYRVKEVLFGQSTTAVGRTSSITGSFAISGTTVQNGSFTVDLRDVSSDKDQRDRQFQGRIMDTAKFPTAKFELTEPIALRSNPGDLVKVNAEATGKLTLHGTTKTVTFDVAAQRNGDHIEVNGTIPVHFSDYGIPNPIFGPASTGDDGELEFLLVFARVA